MGVLAVSGAMDSGGGGGSPRESAEPAADTGAPEPEKKEPEEKGEFVPYSAVTQQRQPGSRRGRAAAEMEEMITSKVTGAIKPLEERWGTERTTYQQQIQQQAQEIARLNGQFEAMQRMPQQPAAPAPAAPDPVKLMEEATAALDAKDIRTYHEKMAAAGEARAQRIAETAVAGVRRDLEGRIPQQMPQEVQFLMAQHRNVALAGPQGVEAVMLKDKELELYRVPRSPQRLAKAFELADKFLASVNGQGAASSRGYDQSSAQALAAVPTTRPASGGSSGGDGDGVHLTPLQLETIKNLGWSKAEYVKWLQPDKFIKR